MLQLFPEGEKYPFRPWAFAEWYGPFCRLCWLMIKLRYVPGLFARQTEVGAQAAKKAAAAANLSKRVADHGP